MPARPRVAEAAAASQLALAARWAELHPAPEGETPAGWGNADLHGEGVVPLAGPGAPHVAEFAPMELAATLGVSHTVGKQLMGDALELRHRLPRLWDLVHSGTVPAWRARQVARLTTDLSRDAATFADKLVSADPVRINQVRAAKLVDEARLRFDPDRAAADEEESLARRGVWFRPGRTPGVTDVQLSLDALHAAKLDETLSDLACQLKKLGDTDSLDVRRAKAVGVLADPQQALNLLAGEVSGGTREGRTVLHLHLGKDDLSNDDGAGIFEKVGAATMQLIRDWLGRTDVTIRPVLDLSRRDAVDRHDPPQWMRELVLLRDEHCVFPGCRRDSRGCDLDHLTEYLSLADGGPPGQTRPDNLAPLCRGHHRAKTHGHWSYKRLDDGRYAWTGPNAEQFTVTVASRRPLTPRQP
jgi:hypothetical protein